MLSERVADVLRKYPSVWERVQKAVDAYLRMSLRQLVPARPPGQQRESASLVASTDTLNVAAEKYFTSFQEPSS